MAEQKNHTLLYVGLAGIAALLIYEYVNNKATTTTTVAPGTPALTGTNITGIQIANGVATPSFTGPNTAMQYALNDIASAIIPAIGPIQLPALAPGSYHLSITPYTQLNGQWTPAGSVNGGSASVDFTV